MKKTLIVIVSILFLASCQKKQCWNCTLVTEQSGTDSTYRFEVCDKTKKEIKDFESALFVDGGTPYFFPGKKKSASCD